MIVFGLTLLLASIAIWLSWIAARRDPPVLKDGFIEARDQFLNLLPKLIIGIMGAGFVAHILPKDTILAWFGPNSGLMGTVLASLAGAATPGGPVVGYAIGAAALKAGADLPQVMAYVTAWSLYHLHRMFSWEVSTMPARLVLLRACISLPVPFLVAGLTTALR